MTTENRDYAAFRARLLSTAALAGLYERRNAPDAPDLVKTIGTIADGLEEFKREQREKLERLETRISRPWALAPAAAPKGEQRPTLIDTRTGKPALEIRRGDDIAARYRAAGLIDDEFRDLTMGDFLRAVAGQKSSPLAQKALSVGTDSAGGYTVPLSLMPAVLDALVANSSLMQAGAQTLSVLDDNEGAKSYTLAGVDTLPTAAWRAENGAVAESDPSFRAIVATPRSLAFYFKVSRELAADGLNMGTVLSRVIGQAMAVAMDRAGLFGSGTAPEPRGIRNIGGIQSVANGTNGASLATTKWANLLSATQAILSANGGLPTAAIMAPRTLVGFGSLADSTGQPLQRPDLLRNLDMIATSQLPVNLTVGSSTDCTEIFLADFSRTMFVMREAVSIQRLSELFATNGQIAFLCHARVDFIATYPSTLALVTGVRP